MKIISGHGYHPFEITISEAVQEQLSLTANRDNDADDLTRFIAELVQRLHANDALKDGDVDALCHRSYFEDVKS